MKNLLSTSKSENPMAHSRNKFLCSFKASTLSSMADIISISLSEDRKQDNADRKLSFEGWNW